MTDDWPFADPPNVAVFTVRQVVRDGKPIQNVWHDADDGGWQFRPDYETQDADIMVVGLAEMLRHDPSLAELADLPLGWHAWRLSATGPWQRGQSQ